MYLRLERERLEPVEEELPGEDPAVAEGVVQLVYRLQDHRTVHYHQVELRLQAVQQQLQQSNNSSVVECKSTVSIDFSLELLPNAQAHGGKADARPASSHPQVKSMPPNTYRCVGLDIESLQ